MLVWGLLASVTIVLIGAGVGSGLLLGSGTVTFVCLLARMGGAPRLFSLLLWVWLLVVLGSLMVIPSAGEGTGETLVLGLPAGAFRMLVGVWIAPLLIWPIGFLIGFRSWLNR